ncbi:ABC transporter ATP-binding protein [candidate division WOR-3 bacterium]|nr:ABC transporter ATP-binding protein [candidate division WOR-3 bacterium]
MNHAVELDRVTVSYRENIALHDISLTVEKGAFVAVVGPNGAGKTTLLTLINGLGTLQHGRVHIFNTLLTTRTINRIRRDIGYVPQHVNIDPRMPICVYDVVMLGRYPRIGMFRNPSKEDHRIVTGICERIGITDLVLKPIGHLSGGEAQKVSLARALAQEPRLLLLDEPTANLDPRAQHEIKDLIEKAYERDRLTVFFVTHILDHLPLVCSHAVLLKKGTIVAEGRIKDVFTRARLTEVYEHPVEPPIMNKEALNA